MSFGKVSWTKFMVTILGQRTFAPSWEQNSTWADARIPSVSPLAFAPRSRSKNLQFHLLNLSRATSETVLHYTFVFEKKIHEIFVNQDEQRVLPIIVWTSIAVRLVKHDPWSSPASDVTVHDVILHSSHFHGAGLPTTRTSSGFSTLCIGCETPSTNGITTVVSFLRSRSFVSDGVWACLVRLLASSRRLAMKRGG